MELSTERPERRPSPMQLDERGTDVTTSVMSSVASEGEAEAGEPSSITIASTGLEFWEYRRACFLAGAPVAIVSSSSSASSSSVPSSGPSSDRSPSDEVDAAESAETPSLPPWHPPPTYTLPPPPPPAASVPYEPSPSSSIGRLESLLNDFPDDAMSSAVTWNAGLGNVHRNLTGSKRLSKGLRLPLVIRILRAGWVREGTWPLDDDGRAVDPPTSPELAPVDPEKEARGWGNKYPPPHEGRRPRRVTEHTIRKAANPTVYDAVTLNIKSLEPRETKSTFGSRLAALIPSSFMSSGGNSSSASSKSISIAPSSAVNAGTDSPMPASPIGEGGPALRQVRPMPGRVRRRGDYSNF